MANIPKGRVVLLVDMDCFYVQVVQRKNPSLFGKPCAVVQYNTWKGGGIIAVGYEAREFGVTRQMRGNEAKEKCPEIHLVHVPENRGKADLTLFREAGAEVIDVLAEFADCLERASIDEAYMDLTESINRNLDTFDMSEVAYRTFQSTHIIGIDNKEIDLMDKDTVMNCDLFQQWLTMLRENEQNYHLAIGAVIADDMRNAVKNKLGFSCSAGIGPNKMLAKVVAGFHKPNQQTLILTDQVEEMFKSTKMRKIRSLGGKLGKQLEEMFGVQYMADLCAISLVDLQKSVGTKSGDMVYGLCRGIDHEPVRPRQLPKSVGCSKNFNGKMMLVSKADVRKWLTSLSEEICERLEKEKKTNHRTATLFTVGCVNDIRVSQSRRCVVAKCTVYELTEEAFRKLSELNREEPLGSAWSPPLINIHLTASKFQSCQPSYTINNYMAAPSKQPDFSQFHKKSSPKKATSGGIENFFNAALRTHSQTAKCKGQLVETNTLKGFETGSLTKANQCTVTCKRMNTGINRDVVNVLDDEMYLEDSLLNDVTRKDHVYSYLYKPKEQLDESNISIDQNLELRNLIGQPLKTKHVISPVKSISNIANQGLFSRFCNKIPDENKAVQGPSSVVKKSSSSSLSPNTRHTSVDDLMVCEKCGKQILVWTLPDHMDFHYAKDLQDSLKADFIHLYNKPNDYKPPKKKMKLQSPSMKDFFGKKSF